MAAVAVFGLLQFGVLALWTIPAIGQWFELYMSSHPGSADFGPTRERIAREGPIAAPATFRYVAWFFRALGTRDDDGIVDRLRRRAVRRLVSYIVFLLFGGPAALLISAAVKQLTS